MFGSTLGNDQHADKRFDYCLTNPPFGKEWKMDQEAVEAEAERGYAGRFGAGLPRISDGQLLFLQHLLSRMKDAKEGGSRVAIVMNGSPLFTGDAGSGESEIRRWILENDWLEAIVALPEQLFYNTGIPTYVWVLTNRKPKNRKGKVQLIDATAIWTPMRKSLGDKRREITAEQIGEITRIFEVFREAAELPHLLHRRLRLPQDHRGAPPAAQLPGQPGADRADRSRRRRSSNLATSKKKGKLRARPRSRRAKSSSGTSCRPWTISTPDGCGRTGTSSLRCWTKLLIGCGMKVPAAVKRAILSALSERDETADICTDEEGRPEPDPELRDTENVPLTEDVQAFFEREVKPHVPDAWINTAVRDHKDGEVGKVGYEINFNRYFYQYQPPATPGGDRGRHQGAGEGHRGHAAGGCGMSGQLNGQLDGAVRRWRRYPAYKDSGLPWTSRNPRSLADAPPEALAAVRPSNVDKKSVEGEKAVRLCNYVDVYKNDYITDALDVHAGHGDRLAGGDVLPAARRCHHHEGLGILGRHRCTGVCPGPSGWRGVRLPSGPDPVEPEADRRRVSVSLLHGGRRLRPVQGCRQRDHPVRPGHRGDLRLVVPRSAAG